MSAVPSRIAAAVCSIALLGVTGLACAQDVPPIGFKKTLENESDKSPDRTPASEAFLIRAYPETDIPTDASFAAISGWSKLNAGAHSSGSWQLIGPSKATYPSVLNPFLFDGAQYVASGRVTAMAISPNCTQSKCTLYIAAAGLIEVLLLLYKPNYTWPGLIIVLLGLPVYFIWRSRSATP